MSQGHFQITIAASQRAIFYNGRKWGKNVDFNHSEGEQLKAVKVGTRIETTRNQASKSKVPLWRQEAL